MKICIVTDDNAGFKKSEIEEIENLFVIRMPILIDGEVFYEDENGN